VAVITHEAFMADTPAVTQARLVGFLCESDGWDNIHPFVVENSDLH